MRADEDDEGETSAFRCLNVARYTVAAVVTVIIVAVIVKSLKVMLRPESLRLSVVDGTVYSTPQPASEEVILQLNLRAENPSGRAHMYLHTVTAYLFDGATQATTSKPDDDCIIFFNVTTDADEVLLLQQQTAVNLVRNVLGMDNPDYMNTTYFDRLYTKGGTIGDAMLRVDGWLATAVSSRFNMTDQKVIYYCWPLLVGEASNGRKDVLCTDNLGSP